MYESPINIIYKNVNESFENGIIKAIQQVDIVVDRKELIKALQYDRDQYRKGYEDAVTFEGLVGVNRGEWTEEGYCPFCKCDMPAFIEDWGWKRCRTPYCPNCGASME